MAQIRDLLKWAGDIPEGIKAALRQTQTKADRGDIEDALDTFTLNAQIEDGVITFELEDYDGEA